MQESQERGGDKADELQVGHETDDADEDAQRHRHGKAQQRETDGKHNAVRQGHQGLAAEVGVHISFHVADHLHGSRTVLVGYEFLPSLRVALVVDKQEEEIEYADERRNDADDDAGRRAQQSPYFGHHLLYDFLNVGLLDELGYLFFAQIGLGQFLQLLRNLLYFIIVVCHVVMGHHLEMAHLVEKGRHDGHSYSRGNTSHKTECQDDAKQARPQPAFHFEESDDGVEHIGEEPGYKERQQYRTQIDDEQV